MAAMLTALTEFSDKENSRTYTSTGHTVSKPKLVVQKRRVPSGNQSVQETTISVIHGTEDSAGAILPQKVSMKVVVTYPISGLASEVTNVQTILRDIIAGDEFANTVTTQEYLK